MFGSSVDPDQLWSHLGEAKLDGNHATAAAFEADPSPLKVNLGRGVYKDDKGKSWVLPSVLAAEKRILESHLSHEYLPFDGLKAFTKETAKFAFGADSKPLNEGRVVTAQTVSGTGALRVGAEFLSRFLPNSVDRTIYVSNPTYVNHYAVFGNAGFKVEHYDYFDPKTCKLNFEAFCKSVKDAPKSSVFLLHACAHNPTGVDPTQQQWTKLLDIFREKQHICFFDCAYQGFASGDTTKDGFAFGLFANNNIPILLAQSYAKNFGLYGQRIGAINVVVNQVEQAAKVKAHLNQVIRPMYSNPPAHGARIVSTVLGDETLRKQWDVDVNTMANRIISMRQTLVSTLERESKHDWSHITDQIGMFAYSGLTEEQVWKLRDKHVYMNLDGRMSISGINSGNVHYLAEAMHEVTK